MIVKSGGFTAHGSATNADASSGGARSGPDSSALLVLAVAATIGIAAAFSRVAATTLRHRGFELDHHSSSAGAVGQSINQSIKGPHKATHGQGEAASQHNHRGQGKGERCGGAAVTGAREGAARVMV